MVSENIWLPNGQTRCRCRGCERVNCSHLHDIICSGRRSVVVVLCRIRPASRHIILAPSGLIFYWASAIFSIPDHHTLGPQLFLIETTCFPSAPVMAASLRWQFYLSFLLVLWLTNLRRKGEKTVSCSTNFNSIWATINAQSKRWVLFRRL